MVFGVSLSGYLFAINSSSGDLIWSIENVATSSSNPSVSEGVFPNGTSFSMVIVPVFYIDNSTTETNKISAFDTLTGMILLDTAHPR